MNKAKQLIDRLEAQHSLSIEEYEYLIENQSDELAVYAAKKAFALRKQVYGTDVYIRGLIEIGNICRNDCYYCAVLAALHDKSAEAERILSRCGLPSGTTDQSRVSGLCSNAVARRVPS